MHACTPHLRRVSSSTLHATGSCTIDSWRRWGRWCRALVHRQQHGHRQLRQGLCLHLHSGMCDCMLHTLLERRGRLHGIQLVQPLSCHSLRRRPQ